MATMNVTDGTKVILTIMDTASGTAANVVPGADLNGLEIPTIQDVTVNATPGTVNYSTLDSSSSSAFTTVNENSISLNILVDDDVFFGASNASNEVANVGVFQTSKNKTECYFSVAFEGKGATGLNYISGQGFIGGLAPSASIDQAVWISPVEIIVNGELSKGTTS